jgi:diaminopimelate epimerase
VPDCYDLIVADPAKNITVFVLAGHANPVPAERRAPMAKAILEDPYLKAEQVGFALSPDPESSGQGRRLWRLEMMGGEFCGNAARSFGLFVARRTGLRGKHTVAIEISGMEGSLPARVNTETGWAETELPKPRSFGTLYYKGRSLPVCRFDGITHVIAQGLTPSRDTFFEIQSLAEKNAGAFGVMFVNDENFMTPAVFVYNTNTLVFESSCGSGSAALAAWKSRELPEGEGRYAIRASGGVIETRVVKREGEIVSIAIGGPVELKEVCWELPG